MNNNDISRESSLKYHNLPQPGKLAVQATKPLSEKDLLFAYTPGVAHACLAIAENAMDAYKYTSKGNLVAVISNGTAVLGLGDIGALASKPVMEGKSVLFKKFANIDAFDIEVNEKDPLKFVEVVKAIAPTFGAINLEDIRSPDCFLIEQMLQEELNIPVMHDDQHGTAVALSAGLLNALEIQGKDIRSARIVFLGAGASALASASLLIKLGLTVEQLRIVDKAGVIYAGRADTAGRKADFAIQTTDRNLADALRGADVFIGLSGSSIDSQQAAELLKSMNKNPIVFALSNPQPEMDPQLIHSVRDDVIVATGRSDYVNQINNAICFPYIFKAALQAGVKQISSQMLIAAVHSIRQIAQEPISEFMQNSHKNLIGKSFGKDYIMPLVFDDRLLGRVTQAIIQASK